MTRLLYSCFSPSGAGALTSLCSFTPIRWLLYGLLRFKTLNKGVCATFGVAYLYLRFASFQKQDINTYGLLHFKKPRIGNSGFRYVEDGGLQPIITRGCDM